MNGLNGNSAVSGTITLSSGTIATVVSSGGSGLVKHVIQTPHHIAIEEEEYEEDEMEEGGGESYGEEEDEDGEEMLAVNDVTSQLAAAGWQHGPVGVAAAAAIASAKKKRRSHAFETNPSIRKRQATRLTRKLKAIIDEFSVRVGQQAVVVVATPGKTVNNFKVFGAKPLEDVVRNLRTVLMSELEAALSQQAPTPILEDPNLHELPPIVIDGIPTPVEKMTQAQLRAFIPLMLKYSTGRGKPGWGKESTKPPWWPKHVPWANVRMDARSDEEKSKNTSWTHALREIVTNCYRFHGREDLLPRFTEDEEEAKKNHPLKRVGQYISGVVQTISNPDGTVSIVHVDPNNPIITLPDGTQAQIQLHESTGVHTLAEVATSDSGHEVHAEHGQHILITGEDGNTYPVQVSGHQLVTVPASIYQTVVAQHSGGDGGGTSVQMLQGPGGGGGGPLQIAGVTGSAVIMKQEPSEAGGGISLTPVTISSSGQVSVLHMTGSGGGGSSSRRSEDRDIPVAPDTTS